MFNEAIISKHAFHGSVPWSLSPKGLVVNGIIERTSGEPATVRRIWKDYGKAITAAAEEFAVPVELIIATIATESGGNAKALRKEPGYKSDKLTPNRISPGIMQTLISTAREALKDPKISRAWLLEPANSIRAGTAYIARQRLVTGMDPPKVACAYNAGAVYPQNGLKNRWKMRQYPIGTGEHCDRFVKWFNDAMAMFSMNGKPPAMSFSGWWLQRPNGTRPPHEKPDPYAGMPRHGGGYVRAVPEPVGQPQYATDDAEALDVETALEPFPRAPDVEMAMPEAGGPVWWWVVTWVFLPVVIACGLLAWWLWR